MEKEKEMRGSKQCLAFTRKAGPAADVGRWLLSILKLKAEVMTNVLSVRLSSAVYAELARVAAIGRMTSTEVLKAAIESYLHLADVDRIRRQRADVLKQLASACAELKDLRQLIGGTVVRDDRLLGPHGVALEKALKEVEMAAARIAP